MEYSFTRRTHNLPPSVEKSRTFEAKSFEEALQMAANYWWPGATVVSHITDEDVITLIDNYPRNVIGTLEQI